MKYLSKIFAQYNGTCKPLTKSYNGLDGNKKSTTNISIVSYNGRVISNIRLTDYLYIPLQATDMIMYFPTNGNIKSASSCNAIGPVEGEHTVYKIAGTGDFSLNGVTFTGLEDIRLVVWNGILYGIGFRPDVVTGKVIVQLVEYNEDLTINRSWFLNTNKSMEKNWQPVEDMPFTFMYDPDKSYILTLDINELKEADNINNPTIINDIETPDFTFSISGSTQLIKLKDGRFVSICHTGHRYTGNDLFEHWVYNHYFVVYDENLNRIWTSEPFRFVADCMEFTCGMCHHNNDLYISFSMLDGITNLMTIPFDTFHDILTSMMEDSTLYEDEPNNEYMVQCYDSNEITGPAKLAYMCFLECIHRLDSVKGLDTLLDSLTDNGFMWNGVALYFITRRRDCDFLLKELK